VIRWVRDLIADGYVGEVLSSAMLVSFPGGGATFTSGSAYTTGAIATLRTEAINIDTGATIPKTAPDQLAITGRLPGGAVASMHFRGGALRTTPLLWEIDGTRSALRITARLGLPMSAALAVEDAPLAPLELPAAYARFPSLAGTPAHNVAHLYAQVAEALQLEPFSDVYETRR
jgi:hypothetical protein